MKKKASGSERKPFNQRRSLSLIVAIVLNVVFLVGAVLCYGRYADAYQERLREENLGNIANMNRSSALNATALFNSWDIKLDDIARYVDQHKLTLEEALAFIEESNSRQDRQFELIGDDYTGYLASRDDGGFIPLNYVVNAYASLHKAFDDIEDNNFQDICFTPEFTDGYTAVKNFAVYRHISLKNDAGEDELFTLLLATRARDVLSVFNSQKDYQGQSTVLINESGSYIVSSVDFKSDNFFQYLYVYNELSLDQRQEIEQEVAREGSGELYYKDAKGRDSVFIYERMGTNSWYCVTSVLIANFRTPTFNINYAIYAVISLFMLLVTDVVWLQQNNRQLRQSVLREKEASDAKTVFLSRMSHDIRTPLNGIIGLTTLALDRPVDEETREYLSNIRISGQFLFGLVNDILDLSKVESGKVELNPEPYTDSNLRKYVEAVVLPLCKSKGIELRVSSDCDKKPVMLDRLRFNQIMFNLLSNAVKYTPAGGLVELSWTRTPLGEGRVKLDFTVRDNGIGMSEEFQKRMFESFSQESPQTASTGSGLGLAIVNNLIKLMGGSIEVESKQQEGSAFSVHLETVECPEESADASENEPDVSLEGKRALLCEDNAINIIVAQRMLEKWGMRVVTAVNGRLGLETFKASEPGEFDVILMDVMMPEMNGLDATRAIRGLDRPDAAAIPILAMTANAYDSDVQNCLDAGMNAHTGKPIEPELLYGLLVSLINGAADPHDPA